MPKSRWIPWLACSVLAGAPAVYPPEVQLFGIGARQTVIAEGENCTLTIAGKNIATLESGRVVAKATGSTWLHAKCADGVAIVPVTIRLANNPSFRPPIADLRAYPKEQILVGAGTRRQLVAVAYYEGGAAKDVTPLVEYLSNRPGIVQVDSSGAVTALRPGEASVMIRTERHFAAVRVTVAASEPDPAYPKVTRNNFIDEHVFNKLRRLNIRPSKLTNDTEFLRRVYLATLGRLPGAGPGAAPAGPINRVEVVDELLRRPEFADGWARRFTPASARKLRQAFAENVPFDKLAPEFLASGPIAAGRILLGIRLDCAACHNHPWADWTKKDLDGFAAFFAPGGTPKYPGGGAEQGADTRALARWITRPGNPYFAPAVVNRVWKFYLGRGLVEEIDDFRPSNPPTNPALLDALAADFVRSGYNFRRLVRTILLSRTYQLSAEPNDSNRHDSMNYSRYLISGN